MESVKKQVSTDWYDDYNGKENFEVLNVDEYDSYERLIDELEQANCEGKSMGLSISDVDRQYNFTVGAFCPDSGAVGCYFRVRHFYIKNDLIDQIQGNKTHINSLKDMLNRHIKEDYNYKNDKPNELYPAIIWLYMEPEKANSLMRSTLLEIAKAFHEVNQENPQKVFNHAIMFDRYHFPDVPPPPPPASLE